MKAGRFLIWLLLLMLLGGAAWAQSPIPSTVYTRDLMRSTNAATARAKLGVAATNAPLNSIGAINVLDPAFSCPLDGTSDCTAAIQAALTLSTNNPVVGGGVVYLPAGVYAIAGTIHVPKHTTLAGDTAAFSSLGTQLKKSGTGATIQIDGGNCTIRNIYMQSPNTTADASGIRTRGYPNASTYFTLDHVRVWRFRTGYFLDECWTFSMNECYATGCGDAITMTNSCNNAKIIGGEYTGNTNGCRITAYTAAGSGANMFSTTFQNNQIAILSENWSTKNVFEGSYFEGNTNNFTLKDVEAWSINDCLLESTGTNIILTGTTRATTFSNNHMTHNSALHAVATVQGMTWRNNRVNSSINASVDLSGNSIYEQTNLTLRGGAIVTDRSITASNGIVLPFGYKSANYTMWGTETDLLLAANLIVNLPSAVTNVGKSYCVTCGGVGTNALVCVGSETINGYAKYTNTAQWKHTRFVSSGTNWFVTGQN